MKRTLAVLSALAVAASATPAAADTGLSITPPTGRTAVGTTSLYLKDTSRPDPWVPSAGARELMVSLFYPAASARGREARYMTPAESAAMLADSGLTDVPADLLSRTRTNSVEGARPAGRPHSLPLVVLSPGYTKPRATLTALAEDLASHGYVVVVVGHTYENHGTSFPDGRFATCASCEVDHLPEFWQKLARGRAADVSFVLDELTGRHPAWRGARLVDRSRIAMGGHSAGGGSTTGAMVADPRIRAGFDVDGTPYLPLPASGEARPFLFLGKYPPGAPFPACSNPDWQGEWAKLTGPRRWFEVSGAQHASFTDLGLFADQLGVDIGATVTGERVQTITRTHVRTFLDVHLRGQQRPAPDYPEVISCG
jgi:dienelactone hydrolase